MGKITIHIDQVKCVGAGSCVLVSPEVFDQREEDGIVVLLMDNPPESLMVSVKKAAKLCPALAIVVEQK